MKNPTSKTRKNSKAKVLSIAKNTAKRLDRMIVKMKGNNNKLDEIIREVENRNAGANIQTLEAVKIKPDLNDRYFRLGDMCRALTGLFRTIEVSDFFDNSNITGGEYRDYSIRGFGVVMNMFSDYTQHSLTGIPDDVNQPESERVNIPAICAEVKRYADIIKGYSRSEDISELLLSAKFDSGRDKEIINSFLSCLSLFNDNIYSLLDEVQEPLSKVS